MKCAEALVLGEGTVNGVIATEPRGNGGFGYDPLFFLPERGQTMAESLWKTNSGSVIEAARSPIYYAPVLRSAAFEPTSESATNGSVPAAPKAPMPGRQVPVASLPG